MWDYYYLYNIAKFSIPDKAGPFVRRARKAAGLVRKTAELPKEKTFGMPGFFILTN